MNEKACRISQFKKAAHQLLSDEGRARIRAGDSEYVDLAISYLEADPYFDGTGYVKSYLVRYLKLVPFSAAQHERLRALILRVIETYGPFGGKHVCRLAASVQSPEFLSQVQVRFDSQDHDTRRRARNIYAYVQRFNQSTRNA
ncbi:hypothetical protein CfE428DRAFT_6397 [Chthoniobacter flavus Ellin428]|uniref:Uncharacterized protein n=1 Tax=Chthoniobacter flavus Ellin428 TaxID=497964 RepID=B4DBV6_9BACT|nr:hypothetical protein [Chthoniobacter flavus]EDY16072.1 hypothetical protein CfE428DRAFT_6397 [Chthoniobacter flavus Ellin428]TCO83853.1 hypothetical protein EV701_1409 [Chthoniobacter flavus]